jgi:dTDP-4-amino-4,6-dideoxygalactose transaminase
MHATKPFCIGEGGLLISRDKDLIEEARCLSNFGTMSRITLKDGVNAKLSEYLGAVALAQLDRWHDVKQKRRNLFARYRAAIEKAGLELSFQQGIDRAIIGTLMLRSSGPSASHIANALNACGIFAHRMYLPPLYHHPFFADLKVANDQGRVLQGDAAPEQKTALMQHAEAMQENVFGLPFHNFMDDADIDYVLRALTEVMDQPRMKTIKAH